MVICTDSILLGRCESIHHTLVHLYWNVQPQRQPTENLKGRAFDIFQVDQYIMSLFLIKFEQHSLKSGGTKDHFRQVKVPGNTPH